MHCSVIFLHRCFHFCHPVLRSHPSALLARGLLWYEILMWTLPCQNVHKTSFLAWMSAGLESRAASQSYKSFTISQRPIIYGKGHIWLQCARTNAPCLLVGLPHTHTYIHIPTWKHNYTHWPVGSQVWFCFFSLCDVFLSAADVRCQQSSTVLNGQLHEADVGSVHTNNHSQQQKTQAAPRLPAGFKQAAPGHKMFLGWLLKPKELMRRAEHHPPPSSTSLISLCHFFVGSCLDGSCWVYRQDAFLIHIFSF